MTTRTSQPRATRASSVRTKSPFFDFSRAPASVPVRSSRSPAPRARSAEHRLEQVLEVAALGRRPGPLGAAGRGGGLDRDEALLERLEAGRHLLAELVHRRVEPGRDRAGARASRRRRRSSARASCRSGRWRCRASSRRTARRPSSRSAPRSPRNFSSVRGSRPSPSAKFARSVCSSASAAFSLTVSAWRIELLELGPHDVDVDRDAGVLEGEQADPQGALDERRAVVGRALGEERGERRGRGRRGARRRSARRRGGHASRARSGRRPAGWW